MNSFLFSITSNDGKFFEENVEEVYFTSILKGDRAILSNSEDLGCLLDVSKIFYKKNDNVYYISISGGIMSFHDNSAIFIVDTFELENEIDKNRVLKAKFDAENILKDSTKSPDELKKAEFSLKKALNRLSILK